MRPLLANPKRANEARSFHAAVFAKYGSVCIFCGKKGATDAAHVLSKASLGPLRYADARFARPAHRACHEAQHAGKATFPKSVIRDAVRAHNQIATVKIQEPA